MSQDSPKRTQRIIDGGRGEAYWANVARVRAEVAQEFAEALAKAGFWKRLILRIRMRRAVALRMERIAPSGGLYAATPRTLGGLQGLLEVRGEIVRSDMAEDWADIER